jgi:hypothetical protein
MIDKNRLPHKVSGYARGLDTLDGTKPDKWFNLKLVAEPSDIGKEIKAASRRRCD